MRFECNFGTLARGKANARKNDGTRFRIALLGDFSGRAMTGQLATGSELAKRKLIRVDIDNLDDIIQRMGITVRLPIGTGDDSIELEISSMDDFHPDELVDKLEFFDELKSLRQRLLNDRTSKAAAEEVRQWVEESGQASHPGRRKKAKRKLGSRGSTIPVGGKLSDFARLTGKSITDGEPEPDVEELIKQLIAPYVNTDVDPDRDALVAAIDASLSGTMRGLLHQSDFQAMESMWRGVDLLIRRLETSQSLQLVLYDISAEEIAADLSEFDDLEESGLYKLLVEQPAMDASQGSIAVMLGHYVFDETPPHAELLGRVAKIAAAANAPFVSSISKQVLERKKGEEPHPLVTAAWSALKELPEAKYLALTVPQFLLRLPYGKKSDPVTAFAFEEFTPQSGVSGMLWGNGVLLVGLMLGQTYSAQSLKKMQIGSIMSFNEMPFHYCYDADGDQIALPCTDRLLSQRMAMTIIGSGYIPVLSIQGQPVVRLGSTRSVAGVELAGVWPESADAAQMQAEDRQRSKTREEELRSTIKPRAKKSGGGNTRSRDDLMHAMQDGTFDEDDDEGNDDDSDSSDDDSMSMESDDDSDSGDDSGSDDDSDDDSDSDDASDSDDDTDLEALLASMGGDDITDDSDTGDDSSEDNDMDPELAALLADL